MVDPQKAFHDVIAEMKKKIAGKDDVLELMFIALVANGHVLLEGVPGVAKTTMTKTLADIIDASFGRVQGTPDLEISDIVGYTYLDEHNQVQVKKGAIFTNIFLIDEMNRMQPKTMSALLETLEERIATIGGVTLKLPDLFIAFATQNPLNIEGTIPLPKVMADRFIFRIEVKYPTEDEEVEMLKIKQREEEIKVNKILTKDDILDLQKQAKKVEAPENVLRYIARLVDASREDIHVVMGGSPRAEISFLNAAKARALIHGRNEITIDDIKFLAKPVLSHRIAVRSTGGIGVNGIIDGLLASVPTS
ncbi:MAG: ATPase [Candidatus Micrarchaeota archaeon]|nr:MAG: ATPase [Candidatus Micrarchaeota archaeon]